MSIGERVWYTLFGAWTVFCWVMVPIEDDHSRQFGLALAWTLVMTFMWQRDQARKQLNEMIRVLTRKAGSSK